jgi:hypothetical protein
MMYHRCKIYFKFFCIMGYTKLTNSDKFVDLKNIYTTIYMILILCSPKYIVFEHDFFHVCRINIFLHVNIFSIYLKLKI